MRIVSLAPSNTEILYELGLGDDIVAVTRFCDFPEEARQKPKIGGWTDVDFDKVLEHKPDLVVTSTFVQEKVREECKGLGVNVLHLDPRDMRSVYESIMILAEATDTKEKARQMIEHMKLRMAKIHNAIKALPKKHVYVEEWHKPASVSGNWVPEMLELAGAEGIADPGEPSRPISLDEVKDFDPEIMILSLCGFKDQAKKEIITEREGWESLEAVKNDEVYVIDDSFLNRPGPRLVEGLALVAKIVHPEAFED
jgi:iron complex transport system substrate-binding protein